MLTRTLPGPGPLVHDVVRLERRHRPYLLHSIALLIVLSQDAAPHPIGAVVEVTDGEGGTINVFPSRRDSDAIQGETLKMVFAAGEGLNGSLDTGIYGAGVVGVQYLKHGFVPMVIEPNWDVTIRLFNAKIYEEGGTGEAADRWEKIVLAYED